MARLIRMTPPPIGAKIDAGHLHHVLDLFLAT